MKLLHYEVANHISPYTLMCSLPTQVATKPLDFTTINVCIYDNYNDCVYLLHTNSLYKLVIFTNNITEHHYMFCHYNIITTSNNYSDAHY